jgi:hypothetical protein
MSCECLQRIAVCGFPIQLAVYDRHGPHLFGSVVGRSHQQRRFDPLESDPHTVLFQLDEFFQDVIAGKQETLRTVIVIDKLPKTE